MLTCLHIENVAVIERVDIELGGGLIALTGETGAGKSIIIDSLNMLMGNRTSRNIVRTGNRKATVNASFTVSAADTDLIHACEDCGIEPEDGMLILQREVFDDGKSTSRINGRQVTASVLRQIGKYLVNINGQQDSASLLDSSTHIRYLDRYASNSDILESYRKIYRRAVSLKRRIMSVTADADKREKRIELLNFQISEINAAALTEDEEEKLKQRRSVLMNAEKIAENLEYAGQFLRSGGENAVDLVSSALKQLQHIENLSQQTSELYGRLSDALESLEDIAEDIRRQEEGLEFSRDELEQTEERLQLISDLKHKYGRDIRSINEYAAEAAAELEQLQDSENTLSQIESDFEACAEELAAAAEQLTQSRRAAAAGLEKAIMDELAFLNMPDVRFKAEFGRCAAKSDGCDVVEFLLSANKGEQLKPLAKIASGGELSRIMLSIKNVLADTVGTCVFDEIDSGVSGRAAQKIAMKLKQMSAGRQVIAVTHLAYIAAYADHHFLIEKHSDAARTYTAVRELDNAARIDELARILGGINITEAVRSAAEEMLRTGLTSGTN